MKENSSNKVECWFSSDNDSNFEFVARNVVPLAEVTVVSKGWSLGLTWEEINGGGDETWICNERVGELLCESDDLTEDEIKSGWGGKVKFSFNGNDAEAHEDDDEDDDEIKILYSLW